MLVSSQTERYANHIQQDVDTPSGGNKRIIKWSDSKYTTRGEADYHQDCADDGHQSNQRHSKPVVPNMYMNM